jgi:hypothetical protein
MLTSIGSNSNSIHDAHQYLRPLTEVVKIETLTALLEVKQRPHEPSLPRALPHQHSHYHPHTASEIKLLISDAK